MRRVRSNTPLQALVGLNEPVAVECAKGLARRIVAEAKPSDAARLEHGFRLCVARAPTADEAAELARFFAEQKQRLAAGWLNAWQILGYADADAARAADVPKGITPTELAAWTAVSRVLLNLDETITKE